MAKRQKSRSVSRAKPGKLVKPGPNSRKKSHGRPSGKPGKQSKPLPKPRKKTQNQSQARRPKRITVAQLAKGAAEIQRLERELEMAKRTEELKHYAHLKPDIEPRKGRKKIPKKTLARRRSVYRKEFRALAFKDKVKVLRKYLDGFSAEDGYNLREAKDWTPRQRARIAKLHDELAPFVLRPHVRTKFRSKAEKKALIEFSGMTRVPKGIKAVPIVAMAPEKTKITVEGSRVKVKRGRTLEQHYFVPPEFKKQIVAGKEIESVVWRFIKTLPDGMYFVKTGEHEAYTSAVEHQVSASKRDNLLLREVRFLIGRYPERFAKFFRGFRRIADLDESSNEKVFAEQRMFRERKEELEAARRDRYNVKRRKARRRARRRFPYQG